MEKESSSTNSCDGQVQNNVPGGSTATENDRVCDVSRSAQKDLCFAPTALLSASAAVDTEMEEETAEVQRSLMVESPDLNDYTRKMQTLLQLIDADKLSPRLRAAVELQAELFFNRLPPMVITGDMNDYTDNVKRS